MRGRQQADRFSIERLLAKCPCLDAVVSWALIARGVGASAEYRANQISSGVSTPFKTDDGQGRRLARQYAEYLGCPADDPRGSRDARPSRILI
jgi:hypothetical protein